MHSIHGFSLQRSNASDPRNHTCSADTRNPSDYSYSEYTVSSVPRIVLLESVEMGSLFRRIKNYWKQRSRYEGKSYENLPYYRN